MYGTIDSLIDFFSFTAWIFYGGAMLALIVMRFTKPHAPRPYKVTWGMVPYNNKLPNSRFDPDHYTNNLSIADKTVVSFFSTTYRPISHTEMFFFTCKIFARL